MATQKSPETKPLAIVTGASSGIGEAVARGFAEAGARVAGISLDGGVPVDGIFVAGDTGDAEAVETLAARVEAEWGGIDVWVNNAARLMVRPVLETSDDDYAEVVRRIIEEEIGNGEGANLVIGRHYRARVADWGHAKALTVLRRLLERERGAYWTFCFFTGDRYLIGASPERHVSVHGGDVRMNPISGTFRLRGVAPETAIELQQHARRGTERDGRDRAVLRVRKRRLECDLPKRCRWKGADEKVGPLLDDA